MGGPWGDPGEILGGQWGSWGWLLDFAENWTSFSEQTCQNHCSVVQNQMSWNSPPGSRGSRGNGGGPTAVETPPSTRAGGQDDGSLTNSLKLYIYIYVYTYIYIYICIIPASAPNMNFLGMGIDLATLRAGHPQWQRLA